MRVKDVMARKVVCCTADANVGIAVELMWEYDCGMLPVVGSENKLTGIVTDRDICIAMGTRNRLPGNLTVGEVATRPVFTCAADDEIHEAMSTMAERQVRRLPVVNRDGVPVAVLSMDDIITHGDLNKWQGLCELSAEEIIRSLKQLYRRERPRVDGKAATAG